jgi:hypothetical protein
MSDPIYLDFNATTPVDPRVREAMLPWLGAAFGNPSSDHVYGRRAKEAVAGVLPVPCACRWAARPRQQRSRWLPRS